MDLAIPLICNLLFVFFSISIFSYRKWPFLKLELPVKYIALYVVIKLLGYHFVAELSIPDSEDFSGDYYVTNFLEFGGGIVLVKLLNLISLNHFYLKTEPSEWLLYLSLAFDFSIFYILSIFKRNMRAKKTALRKNRPESSETRGN